MTTGKVWGEGDLLDGLGEGDEALGKGSGDTLLQRSKSAEARAESRMCCGQVIGERSVWLDHSRYQGAEAGGLGRMQHQLELRCSTGSCRVLR